MSENARFFHEWAKTYPDNADTKAKLFAARDAFYAVATLTAERDALKALCGELVYALGFWVPLGEFVTGSESMVKQAELLTRARNQLAPTTWARTDRHLEGMSMGIELKTTPEIIRGHITPGYDIAIHKNLRIHHDALAAHALLLAINELPWVIADEVCSRAAHHHNRMIRGE